MGNGYYFILVDPLGERVSTIHHRIMSYKEAESIKCLMAKDTKMEGYLVPENIPYDLAGAFSRIAKVHEHLLTNSLYSFIFCCMHIEDKPKVYERLKRLLGTEEFLPYVKTLIDIPHKPNPTLDQLKARLVLCYNGALETQEELIRQETAKLG